MKSLASVLGLYFSFLVLLCAQPAPDFTITATDAQVHSLYNDYLNEGKTVVLEIMFTTCPPCNNIAPLVEVLNQDWGAGQMDVVFISLSDKSFDDNSDVAAWETAHGLTYHGAGQDGGSLLAVAPYKSGTYGQFLGTPTFVVIAPDGAVTFNPRGSSPAATIDSIDVAIANTGAQQAPVPVLLGGQINNANDVPVANVFISITGQNLPIQTDASGSYQSLPLDIGSSANIQPSKTDNARNGVNILDVILTQRHILFVDTLENPYQIIAADVNSSQDLNVLDLIFMQRMILLVDDEFPNTPSWRFIPEDYIFPNPQNPLSVLAPDHIQVNNVQQDQLDLNFVAIKVGDVSGDANPAFQNQNEHLLNSQNDLFFEMEDRYFEKGAIFEMELPNLERKDLLGFQLALQFDTDLVEILELDKGDDPDLDQLLINDSQTKAGLVPINWFGNGMLASGPLFKAKVKVLKAGRLSEMVKIRKDEKYHLEAYTNGPGGKIQSHDVMFLFNSTTNSIDKTPYSIQIYPNPIKDNFTLAHQNKVSSLASFSLYDLSGKLLGVIKGSKSGKNGNNTTFSLRHYPPGMYFLQITQPRHNPLIIKLLKI